jgi:flagellar export protein FliJ
MTTFRFGLEKVLEWRRRQLEAEENRFKQQAAALAELDRRREWMQSEGASADRGVRQWQSLTGGDLAALAEFREHVHRQMQVLAARHAECQRDLDERRRAMLEARRRARLLERLKERRWEEWRAAAGQELEELAAESYLSRWNRERRGRRIPEGPAGVQ